MTILDAPRLLVLKLIADEETDMATVSKAIGRNHAYLQQYVRNGKPAKLSEDVRAALGKHFRIDPNCLRDENDPQKIPHCDDRCVPDLTYERDDEVRVDNRSSNSPTTVPGSKLVIEYDVSPQAGSGALIAEEDGSGSPPVKAQWYLPTDFLSAFVSDAGKASVIRVAGDSMEPDYQAGERLLIDMSHTVPSPPGVYVIWDGFGLVLKRIEIILHSEPPRVKLSSSNSAYDTYERFLDEVIIRGRVVGKWLWK